MTRLVRDSTIRHPRRSGDLRIYTLTDEQADAVLELARDGTATRIVAQNSHGAVIAAARPGQRDEEHHLIDPAGAVGWVGPAPSRGTMVASHGWCADGTHATDRSTMIVYDAQKNGEPTYAVALTPLGFQLCYSGADGAWYPLAFAALTRAVPSDLRPRNDGLYSSRCVAQRVAELLSANI